MSSPNISPKIAFLPINFGKLQTIPKLVTFLLFCFLANFLVVWLIDWEGIPAESNQLEFVLDCQERVYRGNDLPFQLTLINNTPWDAIDVQVFTGCGCTVVESKVTRLDSIEKMYMSGKVLTSTKEGETTEYVLVDYHFSGVEGKRHMQIPIHFIVTESSSPKK